MAITTIIEGNAGTTHIREMVPGQTFQEIVIHEKPGIGKEKTIGTEDTIEAGGMTGADGMIGTDTIIIASEEESG